MPVFEPEPDALARSKNDDLAVSCPWRLPERCAQERQKLPHSVRRTGTVSISKLFNPAPRQDWREVY